MKLFLPFLLFCVSCTPNTGVVGDAVSYEELGAKTVEEQITDIGSIPKTTRDTGAIEITEINSIENGVEVFARVWNKKDKRIGFGRDGSVDVERFVIINPPSHIQTGTVTTTQRTATSSREIVEPVFEKNLQEALLQTLENIVAAKKEKFNDSRIVDGKVGNTTTTVFPDDDPESTSVDGITGYDDGANTLSWAGIRAATANVANANATTMQIYVIGGTTTDEWRRNYRLVTLFDTSSIPDDDEISSATLSLYPTSRDSTLDLTVNITSSNPDSNTAVTTSDYAQAKWGSTKFSTGILISGFTLSDYNEFTLNASGISNISKTGVSKFGVQSEEDIDNSSPTWSSGVEGSITFSTADVSGTTQDPMLVIEHAAASSCTYSGTGDWNVLAKDNCYVNSDTYVQGKCVLLNTEGPGALHIIDGARLACHGLESTSTPIHAESGTFIDLDNQG